MSQSLPPTEALSALFGGRQSFADAVGVHRTLINKWAERKTSIRKVGHIPPMYNETILAAAKLAGIPHRLVAAYLDMHACPLCGRKMPPGVKIDAERARRIAR